MTTTSSVYNELMAALKVVHDREEQKASELVVKLDVIERTHNDTLRKLDAWNTRLDEIGCALDQINNRLDRILRVQQSSDTG